jgi:ubiquitin thioesterase protein OTUB1
MPANLDDASNQYKQTEAQLEAIEAEIKAAQSLTSAKLPTLALRTLYDKDSNFDKGVLYLAKHYRDVRRVRGDGNCFYRALLYGMCEALLIRSDERQRITTKIRASLDQLVTNHGYERYTLEAFWEELVELLENMTQDSLHSTLNEENATSDYATWYFRVLTSAHLKADPDRFVHFIEEHPDIPTFCAKEVEPMGRECGMVQVLALAEVLEVNVVVEYLDGRDFGDKLQQHQFGPEDSKTKVTLLYRPGHYDILYK